MKYFLSFATTFTLIINVSGQINENLEKELYANQDSILRLISNSQRLIMENAKKGNFNKVKEIRVYLDANVDYEVYRVFQKKDEIYLNYLTGYYDQLMKYFLSTDSSEKVRFGFYNYYNDLYFSNENLSSSLTPFEFKTNLRDILKQNKSQVEAEINSSEALTLIERDFLLLYLSLIIQDKPKMEESSNDFLAKYPSSVYDDFVKEDIRRKYIKDQNGFAGAFVLGGAVSNFSGGMDDFVRLDGNYILNFELYNNRWMFAFGVIGSYGEVRQDFSDKGLLWSKNLDVDATFFGLNVGYAFIDSERFRFAPLIKLGGMSFIPNVPEKDDEQYEDYKIGTFSYGYGGLLDVFPFKWIGRYDDQLYRIGIRTQLGQFQHHFSNSNKLFTGSLDYLSIGVIWDISRTKIDYR